MSCRIPTASLHAGLCVKACGISGGTGEDALQNQRAPARLHTCGDVARDLMRPITRRPT